MIGKITKNNHQISNKLQNSNFKLFEIYREKFSMHFEIEICLDFDNCYLGFQSPIL